MAGIEIRGFEELKRNAEKFGKAVAEEALLAAENAAAAAVKRAVEAAAPRKTGQLAGSVIVYESLDSKALTGSPRRRLLVGPAKKKGYYGFFLEKGWISTGRARRARKATETTHSQRGISGGRAVPPNPWFSSAAVAVESEALKAGTAAFNAVIEKITGS